MRSPLSQIAGITRSALWMRAEYRTAARRVCDIAQSTRECGARLVLVVALG